MKRRKCIVATILALSGILGLDKYAKYGGMHKLNTTRAEYCKMSVGPKDLPELSHIYPQHSGLLDLEPSISMGITFWRKASGVPVPKNL